MTQTTDTHAGATHSSPRDGLSQLLELRLLRTSGQLLAAHWWQLAIVGLCAYALHAATMELSVLAYRAGALPGLLVFSLVPLVPLLAVVVALLLLRRHIEASGRAALYAAVGSVLIPFLVVYESQGDFRNDLTDFFNGGFNYVADQQAAEGFSGGDTDPTAYDGLVLDTGAPVVLLTVLIAFLFRVAGARVAERESLWRSGRLRVLRGTLRALAGFSEVVWIVIGAAVIRTTLVGLQGWWEQRRIGDSIADWWDSIDVTLPLLRGVWDVVASVVGLVLDGAVTGLVAPAAWLAIGVIVYGRSVTDAVSERDLLAAAEKRRVLTGVATKVDPALVGRAWRRVASPEGRFGALVGGGAMVLRSRYVPLLVFCVVYTIVATGVPYAIWQLAYLVVGDRFEYSDWLAAYGPINALVYVVVLCLTTPLIAAYSDGLLARFGAPSQLRIAGQPSGSSM